MPVATHVVTVKKEEKVEETLTLAESNRFSAIVGFPPFGESLWVRGDPPGDPPEFPPQ
jgi:hypothetical protein